MILESKRAFITSLIINIISFICLVSVAVHLTNSLSYSAHVNKELNRKIAEQNETIVKKNEELMEHKKKLVEQGIELTDQTKKIGSQNKLIVEQGIEIKNQTNTIDELQNKVASFSCKPKSCKDIKDSNPCAVSGIYEIEVDGEKLEVRCEMNSASDVWTVFHNRYDGSVDFNRNWTSFEVGFGKINGEFWLGLKNLNKLTKNSVNDLRIEMSSFDYVERKREAKKKYAEYKEFHVADSSQNYKLTFKKWSYTGNAGDSLSYHNGREFSTFDNDNDASSYNCAAFYGANWWLKCGEQNINGRYSKGELGFEFMFWRDFDDFYKQLALKSMTLMFREVV